MAVKVSVVVPVYNPGPYMETCVTSLLAQSLPLEDLELIFVDDGSSDDAPARLRKLEEAHSNVRVIRIPNSGWPGKPRNVGTDAAQGEYVMFVDQDDALEPESLERMYTLGAANGADVVLGKVISDFRGVHHNLYREQRPHCDVFSAQLMNSLTPHKMLRTEFLREQNIRYPEGRRRLEDQLFMTKVYFAAQVGTIVADYVCYRYLRRADGRNAGSTRIEPDGYYGNLREVLDVVDAGTTSGEQRDGFYRRFLRTEMLGRMGGPNLLNNRPAYLTSLHREVRALMEERFPLSVDAGLGTALRSQAALTRFGTIPEIARQARIIDGIRATARLTGLRHQHERLVEIDVEARMVVGEEPLLLDRGASGDWLLPTSISGHNVSDDQRAVEPVHEMLGDVVIQHRKLKDEWFLPAPLKARVEVVGDRAEVVFTGTATVDPMRAAGGDRLRHGLHDFTVRLQAFGITRSKRLGADRDPDVTPLPLLIDRAGRINHTYDTDLRNLSMNVDAREYWLEQRLSAASFLEPSADGLVLDLGVCWETPPEHVTLTLTPFHQGEPTRWQLRLATPGGTRWMASAGRERLVMTPGTYRAHLDLLTSPGRVDLVQTFDLDEGTRRLWLKAAVQVVGRRLAKKTRRVLQGRLRRS